MWDDPIVSEVRQAREKLAALFGYDVKAIFADLRRRQAELGNRLVSHRRRAESSGAPDRGCQPGISEAHD